MTHLRMLRGKSSGARDTTRDTPRRNEDTLLSPSVGIFASDAIATLPLVVLAMVVFLDLCANERKSMEQYRHLCRPVPLRRVVTLRHFNFCCPSSFDMVMMTCQHLGSTAAAVMGASPLVRNEGSISHDENTWSSRINTVKVILGADAKVMCMSLFLDEYFASSQIDLTVPNNLPVHEQIAAFVVAPYSTLAPVKSVDPSCRQSLASLVDDAVWVLLQRPTRYHEGQNILCKGYLIPQFYNDSACPSMHAAAVMTQINNNVLFWKTNLACRLLHELVGDQVMRTILVNTSVFVPILQKNEPAHSDGNYMQVCGPSCKPGLMQQPSLKIEQKRRKRNRQLSTSQQPQNLLPQAHIPNKGLLYSSTYVPKIGLPTNHFLNGPCEPETLLKAMIGGQYSCERSSRQQRKRWRNLCAKGFPLCNSMFHKHRSFDYHRLLNRFCPLPKLVTQHEIDIADASAAHSSVDGVIKFVSAVLRNVIPVEMMGSSKNLELLVRHAETFVKLRRQETLANKVAMNGMKITHASWLLMASEKSKVRRTDHQLAHFLLLRVVRWIFGHFLVPLLASTFHVTESEMSGKHILYYRKPVWSIFRSLSMAKLLKQQYTEISPKEAMQRLSLQQMGLSRLRLLPKATGVRPIATLCKQEHFRRAAPSLGVELLKYGADDDEETHTHHFKARKRTMRPRNASSACSTNQILSNVFSVLRDEYNRRQNLFGAGVDGLHYFYPRYRAFINTLRSGMSCITPIYFVSVDIRQAYDSIDQNHLLSIVDKVLSQREYCIQRYDVFHPFPSLGRVIKRSQRKVGTSSSVDPLISRSFTKGFRQSVLIDSVNTCVAQKEHLSKQLFEHLRSHLVTIQGRYGDRYLVQSIGIPQGSILSTILCNFFYGSYEQKTLPDFLTSSSVGESATLLIRMVDDFMLATPNRPLAANFLKAMETGDEELGVSINKSKTKVSATMEMDGIVHSDAAIARRFFPWCGMLFDLKSYAVRIDYARLVADDISSGLTVEQSSHQGIRFRAALRTFIRPRCIPILFDCAINDTRTQTINFYQLYIFSAAKMLAYLKSTDMMHKIKHNLKFIIDAIVSSVKYGHSLIRNRLKQSHVGLELGFSRRVALWIGYTAFHDVLIRSQAFLALAEALHGKIVLLRIRSKPVYFKHAIFEAMQSSGIKDILAKSP